MFDEEESQPFDSIDLSPMLDLSYVLLIIFIIMTTAAVQGTRVELPRSSEAQSLAKPKTKSITVNNEGRVFLNTVPVSLPELEQRLGDEFSRDPKLPVIIRGDKLTQYQRIMEVLDVIGRIGIEQVGLATEAK